MIKIYVDDVRTPPVDHIHFTTVKDTMNFIRKTYKAGNHSFYLDLDHDASDIYSSQGGDYINILKNLEGMRHNGHIRNMNLQIHFHSGNVVGVQNMRAIVQANSSWMKEV